MKEWKYPVYDLFSCTAGDCPFTCCQQWKISVDPATQVLWKEKGRGENLTEKDGECVIRLAENGFCPYLEKDKLCHIVKEEGQNGIPQTCRIFPREIHRFADRTEYALASCCPEVVRFLSGKEGRFSAGFLTEPSDLGTKVRNFMIRQMTEQTVPPENMLKAMFFCLLDLQEKTAKAGVRAKNASYAEIHAAMSSSHRKQQGAEDALFAEWEQSLQEILEAIRNAPIRTEDSLQEINELFLDMTENYRREHLYANILNDLTARAETLEREPFDENISALWKKFRDSFAEQEELCRNYLALGIFADSLLPESGLLDLLVMTEWITMAYAVFIHSAFLKYLTAGRDLTFPEIRDLLVVSSRMTGYNLEDIYEYLENSFDETVWEWGYFAELLPSLFEHG